MAKNKKNRTGRKFDWERAFLFYCEPRDRPVKMSEVARKFGVTTKQVGVIAKRFEWVQRRSKVSKSETEKIFKERKANIEKSEAKQFKMWEKSIKVCEKYVDDIEDRQNKIDNLIKRFEELEGYISNSEISPKKKMIYIREMKEITDARRVYAKELKHAMEALKIANDSARTILGLPKEISNSNVNQKTEVILDQSVIDEMDADFERGTKV